MSTPTPMPERSERESYDCHHCRSYDLPYWCCPYCHRTLTRSNPETRAMFARIDAARERERSVGLRLRHTDGRTTDCPWRFRSVPDLRAAFYEVEGEDPSVDGYEVVEADPAHPVWSQAAQG